MARRRRRSSQPEGSMTKRSLIAAVKHSLAKFSRRYENALVEIRYHTDEAVVHADDSLEVFLGNLLENAIIHNPRDTKRVWVLIERRDNGYEVSIADNGPGVSQREADQNQDDIARKYGGHVEVRSRIVGDPSKGTDFRLWLPSAA